MNSKISSLQKFSGLFARSLLLLLVSTPAIVTIPVVANAAGSGNAASSIKNTNYPIPSGAYFVAPNGKDTNSGRTADSPWPVTKALATAPDGATIVFRGGQYRNVKTNITKQLVLQAYPNEKPWLKGSEIVTGWVNEGGLWRKDGWNHSFPPNMDSRHIDSRYPEAGYGDMVYVNGVALKQVLSKAEVKLGSFYVDSANNRLYIGENPINKTVEATVLNTGLTLWKGKWANPTGAVIRGLGFAHYADMAIKIGAPRVTLEDNTMMWNGIQGVMVLSTDAILRGNTVSYNGRKGIGGRGAHRTLVEGNTISFNNTENFSVNWDASGMKFGATRDLVWRNNLAEYNKSHALWVDESSVNATVVNNITRFNEGVGIFFEISDRAIIASNIAHNNYPAGIMVYNASNARIFNNTLASNHANLIVKETPRDNTKADEIAEGITWITRNNVFKNNILWNAAAPSLFAPSCEKKEPSVLMISNSDYNVYYSQADNSPQNRIVWGMSNTQCRNKYTSLAAFKSATGLESNGLEIINSNDPIFVDASAENFRLKSDSPAINRGQALPTDIADAIGVSSGETVNLGAFHSQVFLNP